MNMVETEWNVRMKMTQSFMKTVSHPGRLPRKNMVSLQ